MQTIRSTKTQILMQYYWDVLSKITQVEQGINDHVAEKGKEVDTVKGLAVAGLIQLGIPFKKDYIRPPKAEPVTKKVGIFTVTEEEEDDPSRQTLMVSIEDDLQKYSVPGSSLERIMGEKFKHIILEEKPPVPEDRQEISITLPPLPEEEETEEKVVEPAAPEDEKKETKAERMPVFRSDPHFDTDPPHKKNGLTFLYNRHTVKLSLPQGVAIIRFYVYPLDVHQEDAATDIFVAAETGEKVRGGVSRGDSAGVSIEFDDVRFIVRGSWKNGQFESIVRCMNGDLAAKMSQTTKSFIPNPRMASTYYRTTIKDVPVDVFPAKYGANEANGYALAVCAIESGTNIGIATPGPDGTMVLDLGNGMVESMQCYWLGSDEPSFHVEIEDA